MINKLEMTNWRAYSHKEVTFGPGITFIMGANGKGKTSILEAICYALTGDPTTVTKRDKLLRDPDRPAKVRLSFTIDDQEYIVERSQSSKKAEGATLTKAGSRTPSARTQKSVTEQIEKIIGVSADFLRRIIYMSEGNVFRFLRETSGKALNTQIRQVLGLTQLDEFLRALKVAEKEIHSRVKEIQQLLSEFQRPGVEHGLDLQKQFQVLDAQRDEIVSGIADNRAKIEQLKRELINLADVTGSLRQAFHEVSRSPEIQRQAETVSVDELHATVEQQLSLTREQLHRHHLAHARLEGEQVGYQRVLDILEPFSGKTDTLPCPVCGKPMTTDERSLVMQNIYQELERLQRDIQGLEKQRAETQHNLDRQAQLLESLTDLRNQLVHLSIQSISPQTPLREIEQIIGGRGGETVKNDIEESEATDQKLQQMLVDLDRVRADFLTLDNRLKSLGYDSPEEAREDLVGLEVRALTLRAASQAAEKTLTTQRDVDMGEIYAQLARVWAAFSGNDQWRIELDPQGIPTLENSEGRQFDLSQFSGGEKTALLVMLHTIIGHHFAKSDFLLIDEPLEHLDAVNRRSLIRFLIGAHKRDRFKQAIVATFEESLIRKYMSDEGVNVIHL